MDNFMNLLDKQYNYHLMDRIQQNNQLHKLHYNIIKYYQLLDMPYTRLIILIMEPDSNWPCKTRKQQMMHIKMLVMDKLYNLNFINNIRLNKLISQQNLNKFKNLLDIEYMLNLIKNILVSMNLELPLMGMIMYLKHKKHNQKKLSSNMLKNMMMLLQLMNIKELHFHKHYMKNLLHFQQSINQ